MLSLKLITVTLIREQKIETGTLPPILQDAALRLVNCDTCKTPFLNDQSPSNDMHYHCPNCDKCLKCKMYQEIIDHCINDFCHNCAQYFDYTCERLEDNGFFFCVSCHEQKHGSIPSQTTPPT